MLLLYVLRGPFLPAISVVGRESMGAHAHPNEQFDRIPIYGDEGTSRYS